MALDGKNKLVQCEYFHGYFNNKDLYTDHVSGCYYVIKAFSKIACLTLSYYAKLNNI